MTIEIPTEPGFYVDDYPRRILLFTGQSWHSITQAGDTAPYLPGVVDLGPIRKIGPVDGNDAEVVENMRRYLERFDGGRGTVSHSQQVTVESMIRIVEGSEVSWAPSQERIDRLVSVYADSMAGAVKPGIEKRLREFATALLTKGPTS